MMLVNRGRAACVDALQIRLVWASRPTYVTYQSQSP